MKYSIPRGLALASLTLSVYLSGCGPAGVEEGMPTEIPKTAVIPVESFKVDMVGDNAKFKADASKAKSAPAPAPEKKN